MNRPYMICHILSALNGKISGSFMGAENNRKMGREYAAVRNAYQADAWLYGTTTTKEFTGIPGSGIFPKRLYSSCRRFHCEKRCRTLLCFHRYRG